MLNEHLHTHECAIHVPKRRTGTHSPDLQPGEPYCSILQFRAEAEKHGK
jgi:hypothetical protein